MKAYQTVFAILFLILLFGFSAFNIYKTHTTLLNNLSQITLPASRYALGEYRAITSEIDTMLSTNLVGGYLWNELYGAVYRALGKNEENSFKAVRDKNGFLYSGNFWNTDPTSPVDIALRIRRFSDQMLEQNTHVVVLMFPAKYNKAWSDGYYGIPYNDKNDYADSILSYFRRYNINHIDYRDVFKKAGWSMEELFFRSDHHWTVQAAFYASCYLIDYLNTTYNAKLDPHGIIRNPDNYIRETYKKIYMGAQGRETGVAFSGLDDYTYIYPKFPTSFKYSLKYRNGVERSLHGTILNTLINRKYPDYSDIYTRELYNSYLGGICYRDEINNELLQGGVNALFIRDSYSSPLATFVAPLFNRTDLIWALYYAPESVQRIINTKHYDYIFIALAADNFSDAVLPIGIEEEEEN